MKKILRNNLIIFSLFLYNYFFAEIVCVTDNETYIYNNSSLTIPITKIQPGFVFEKAKINEDITFVNYNNIKGWIKTSKLAVYSPDNFSDIKNITYLVTNILNLNNNYYIYYYINKKLIKYNIYTREVIKEYKIYDFSDIYPAKDRELFLMEGIITNNKKEKYNYRILDLENNNNIYIGSFYSDKINIRRIFFSKDNTYLIFLFSIKNINYVNIYKTDKGNLEYYGENINAIEFLQDKIFLANNKYLWVIETNQLITDKSLSFNSNYNFINLSTYNKNNLNVKLSEINNKIYLNIANDVYLYDKINNRLLLTHYKSLVFNNSMYLNYSISKDIVYLVNNYKNKILINFSGKEPKIEFLKFCGDHIVGRTKYEKIDALFLYDDDGNELYRYKTTDSPQIIHDNGEIVEMSHEKDLCMISVEIPSRNEFYFIFNKIN